MNKNGEYRWPRYACQMEKFHSGTGLSLMPFALSRWLFAAAGLCGKPRDFTPTGRKSRATPSLQELGIRQVSTAANTPPYHLRLIHSATLTKEMSTGTSTSGPITAAKAAPWWMPKVAMATAIASSKLFDEAVKESVVASA